MKKIFTRLTALLLTAMLTVPTAAVTITADNTRDYHGEFTDVSASAWYYDSVVGAYSLGLINGTTATTFAPEETLSIAQTIKLAALCHQILKEGAVNESAFEAANSAHANSAHWYDGYVSYCMANGIVTEEYDNYDAAASRAQVSILFSRAIISSGTEISEINTLAFGDLPDVDTSLWYASAVYRMVRWGILTGDSNGNLNPEANVKRSEISAIVMRVVDESKRVVIGESKDTTDKTDGTSSEKTDPPSPEAPSAGTDIDMTSLTLYEGSRDNKSFTGITGFAGEFTVEGGIPTTNAAYSLDLINSLTVEADNISFRLYTGAGFEALGIVRGWLNEAARGKDGAAVHEKNAVYASINELCYVWLNGERSVISEMWYADHGDYTTYAFYFDKNVDPAKITSASVMVGRLDSETLTGASMSELAEKIEQADREGVISPEADEPVSDNYKAAIADAKENASEIIFEYESERCDILYGRGLYGRESDEYRLLLIYRDGTVQTVASSKLDNIRMNAGGTVLYYNMTGPDGKVLQYGINFGE